jgi:hypothetical protein
LFQLQKIRPCQGFCKNVGYILSGSDAGDPDELFLNEFPDRMKFDLDVFDGGVTCLILGKARSGIIVTV